MIYVDEFGPLEIRPYPGTHWAKVGEPQRLPATYHRDQGTKTLFAALDLKDDILLGHGKHRKSWRELLIFLNILAPDTMKKNGYILCLTISRRINVMKSWTGRP